ncbi:thiolase domain-containing protein [Qipengyuania flava]|uniref:Thiolase domain-containing protein n=1 Tax=Qipengyuania flava TaxID=192812 RepID=A0A5P6NG71_9SPHN|nr:acetyl-CoA acetyltransferase [Qipengyuania flava]QFI64848.1 thiolase domain-containing protein [Qipengyuania flava]
MVTIIGGWQSDFSRNWAREGNEIADGFAEALARGLEETGLEPSDIQTGHVGNFVADMFAKQGLLGGLFAQVHPELDGLPTSRHEAACASGSMAILAASAEIEAGRYDTACVLGIELMRNVPGQQAAENLGAAIWQGHELQDAMFPWPRAFSDLAEEYEKRYGLDYAHLMQISQVNFANGRRNPNAQTRGWQFTHKSFTACDEANPVVEGRTRKMDCGQVTDGAAVIFLASDEWAAEWARKQGRSVESLSRIAGWGHRSAPLSYRSKVKASADETYVFPQVRRAILEARERAGIDLGQIDAIETHDCFAMTEYMAIDHLGLTAPGESWKAIEEGVIEMGGRLPINASGGLIGLGHPVGATGVRMLLDAHKQVTGTAGDYQVEGAKRVQTLNIGGSTTTTASFVVENAQAA